MLTIIIEKIYNSNIPHTGIFEWGIRVVFGYLFAIVFRFGLVGIWLAYSLDIVVRGIILLLRFLNGKWKYVKID
ncbi:hypothetical protein [Desnuesiella massiliensis]|uniref:hypothetical protein n=1 Tax=Desnuesiella massiliensis TaxID=1650662 RepID=UPI0018A85C71|nr:hypothetical protein [Desnuesiella massiliensis]